MDLEFKLSIGDIINFLILVSGCLALFIQTRALKLAEKELNTKVNDIENILTELNKERETRENQIGESRSKLDETKEFAVSALMRQQNKTHDLEKNNYQYLEYLNFSVMLLSKTVSGIIMEVNKITTNKSEDEINDIVPILKTLGLLTELNKSILFDYSSQKEWLKKLEGASSDFQAEVNTLIKNIDSINYDKEYQKSTIKYDMALDKIVAETIAINKENQEKIHKNWEEFTASLKNSFDFDVSKFTEKIPADN